jgi:hypothetical protein
VLYNSSKIPKLAGCRGGASIHRIAEAKTGGSFEPRSLRPAWATQGEPISKKTKKPGAVAHICHPNYG